MSVDCAVSVARLVVPSPQGSSYSRRAVRSVPPVRPFGGLRAVPPLHRAFSALGAAALVAAAAAPPWLLLLAVFGGPTP